MSITTVLPFQPDAMSPAQLAAVSYLARYSGHTRARYTFQLRRWFAWCEANALDPLIGIQRAHVELYIRRLGDSGLMYSSVVTMMHAVRGYCRFAHIDGLIVSDPAVYARLLKVHRDESRTHGSDRLELIRFLQVAQTITVQHGALAYLLGINALRASEAAAVRIEDYRETLRGHRVLHLVGKGNKPATMPLTVPVLRVLEACRGDRTIGPLVLRPMSGRPVDRRDVYRMVVRIAKTAGIPRHVSPHSLRHAAITNALDAGVPLRDAQILARHADPAPPSTTTEPEATSNATASTSSPPTSPASDSYAPMTLQWPPPARDYPRGSVAVRLNRHLDPTPIPPRSGKATAMHRDLSASPASAPQHVRGGDTSDLVGSTVLGDQLLRCLWEAAHEPYLGIFLDVGIQPVRMALTHGQDRVVAVNK